MNLPSKAGRKLLQKDLSNKNLTSQGVSNEPLPTSKVGIVAGGALLVCCAVLCPCIYGKRRKATAHAVLVKEPNSSEFMVISIVYFYHMFLDFVWITSEPDMCIHVMNLEGVF